MWHHPLRNFCDAQQGNRLSLQVLPEGHGIGLYGRTNLSCRRLRRNGRFAKNLRSDVRRVWQDGTCPLLRGLRNEALAQLRTVSGCGWRVRGHLRRPLLVSGRSSNLEAHFSWCRAFGHRHSCWRSNLLRARYHQRWHPAAADRVRELPPNWVTVGSNGSRAPRSGHSCDLASVFSP